MKRLLLAVGMLFILTACSATVAEINFWLEEAPSRRTIETAAWNLEDVVERTNRWESEKLISVSPSGRYFLVVDAANPVNLEQRRPGNNLGWEASHISVYEYYEGRLSRVSRIFIDSISDWSFNDTVIGADDLSIVWSSDESRMLISRGISEKRNLGNLRSISSDIFLVNIEAGIIKSLTASPYETVEDGAYLDFLPQWMCNENISFIRYGYNNKGIWTISLMSMNITAATAEHLSNLTTDGRIAIVYDYEIYGDYVYFSKEDFGDIAAEIFMMDVSGFYYASLDGGHLPPTILVSIYDMNWGLVTSPLRHITSVQVSPGGRWALLTAQCTRFIMRSIPLANCPDFPQPDPNSAMCRVHMREWIPAHNVFLYDLHNNRLVDPFRNRILRPDVVIVTAATFSPDGRTLICAAFGSGGVWTLDSYSETTLYQVRLDDDSFDVVRFFSMEHEFIQPVEWISWLGNNALWLRGMRSNVPFSTDKLVIPAAFEVLAED